MLDKSLFKKIVGASAAGIEIETTYPMYEKENVLFDVFPNLRSRMDEEGLYRVNAPARDTSCEAQNTQYLLPPGQPE